MRGFKGSIDEIKFYNRKLANWEMLRLYDDPTEVKEQVNQINNNYQLSQNYPNPFNPTTIISYAVTNTTVMLNSFQHLNNNETPKQALPTGRQVRGDNINVSLNVFNILGKEVATLVNKKQSPGNYQVEFDGSNLPSGVYFYRLIVGNFLDTKKMILLR
jgi:hypothetical protein